MKFPFKFAQDGLNGGIFQVPALALHLRGVPADGLPCYEDWLTHALSIWVVKYEHWRESVEVRPIDPALCGQPLGFHSIEPTKGFGRVSILLFTIYWTYHKLKKRLESAGEEMADFRRFLT